MTMTPEMPKLCGGVLFNLLVNSKRSRHKANDSFMGESDGLSNVNCLKGLPSRQAEGPFAFEYNGNYYLTYPYVRENTEVIQMY